MTKDVVHTVEGLVDSIIEARARTEALRRLPEEIVEGLVDGQLFRLAVPQANGGPEVDPLTCLDVYERLAAAEPSVAWAVWNSSLPCLFSRFLDEGTRQEIFGEHDGKYASSTRPTGTAARQNGSFRVSGRWSLVSGCMHADWLGLMCLVEEDGEVEMIEPGAPHMRMAFVPTGSVEILDTWNVGGLRGTGSHDVVAEGVDVPASRTFSPMEPSTLDAPIGRVPIAATMAAGHASICVGMTASALDAVTELGRSKVSPDPAPSLPDRASNQFVVGSGRARLSAHRLELRRALSAVWEAAEKSEGPQPEAVADLWAAAVVCARECRRLVEELYEVAGTPALYVDSPLERHHRDIHAAMQHIIVQRFWLEDVGRIRFGMDPGNPLFFL
ncbi:MAG: hypothetical protein R3304_11250 [Longimicrobiales bacterium]|nr:hypothetical protein [Longimicrobiales bacterium]